MRHKSRVLGWMSWRVWDVGSSFLNTIFAPIQLRPWLEMCRAAGGMAASPSLCLGKQKLSKGTMLKHQPLLEVKRAVMRAAPSLQAKTRVGRAASRTTQSRHWLGQRRVGTKRLWSSTLPRSPKAQW